MTRTALLLYLQNVRDLELAKYALRQRYLKEQAVYTKRRNNLAAAPVQETAPSQLEPDGLTGVALFFGLLFGAFFIILLIYYLSEYGYEGTAASFFLVVVLLGLGLGILFIVAKASHDIYLEEEQHTKDIKAANERNKKAQEDYESRKASLPALNQQWNKRKYWYQQEEEKLEKVLRSFYSMNILPNPYRNLASVLYIYDYMSSSSATLEDTLIHEHMENGIQRLEAKLDIVIDRMGDMLYETRCMRAENRRNIQTTIDQNNRMLESLQESNQNTADAAQYARLAANYSKANAYFSLANYLKK
jgi:hypothetical protein